MTEKPHLSVVPSAPTDSDGRRARSERSRQQIVDAMFSLIAGGNMDPSAASLAEEANVGLRTVFRHFEDMDGLYRELTERLEAEILPIVMTPWASVDWRDRLTELINRRAGIYERIMLFKVAANLRRFQSEWLMAAYKRFLTIERSGLSGILPEQVRTDADLFAALEMLTAFQTWRRMRQDQGLSAADAERVLHRTAEALIAGQP